MRKLTQMVLAMIFLVILYFYVFRFTLFTIHLPAGIDFLFPTSNLPFEISGLYSSWMPGTFGFTNIPTIVTYASLINIIANFFSFGNYDVAQKIMLLSIPFASISMLFLLRYGFKIGIFPSIGGAVLYGYGPIPAHNFGTGGVWELAFFPFVALFAILIIKKQNMPLNSLLLAISTTFMISWGAHIIILLPLLYTLILVVISVGNKYKMRDIMSVLFWTVIAVVFFSIMNLYIIISFLKLFGIFQSYSSPNILSLVNSISISNFYSSYSGYNVISTLSLSTWVPWNNLELLGFALAVFSTSFIFSRDWKKYEGGKLAFSFLVMLVFDVTFILSISTRVFPLQFFFKWFTPIKALWDSIGPTDYINFLIPALTAFTLDIYSKRISSYFKSRKNLYLQSISRNRKGTIFVKSDVIIPLVLSIIVVVSFFTYVPIVTSHYQSLSEGFDTSANYNHEVPPSYVNLMRWLSEQESNGTFRVLVLPMPEQDIGFFNGFLPYNTEPTPNGATGSQFMASAITSLVTSHDQTWGSLLGVASIKYIIVLFNVTSPEISQWYVQGTPRFSASIGLPVGNPQSWFSLLNNQTDLTLMTKNTQYSVFQNKDFKPIVQRYSYANNLYGSYSAASQFPALFNNTLLFSPSSNTKSLPSVFVNDNPTNQLLNSIGANMSYRLTLHSGSGWVLENLQNWTLPLTYLYPLNPYINGGNPFLQTTRPALENYTINGLSGGSTYEIYVNMLFSAKSNGRFSISLDKSSFNSPLAQSTYSVPHFTWTKIGSFRAASSKISLNLTNINGYSAIAGIQIIRSSLASKLFSKEMRYFSSNTSYYYTEKPYISQSEKFSPVYGENFSNVDSWGRGNSWSQVKVNGTGNNLIVTAGGKQNGTYGGVTASYLPRPYYRIAGNQVLKFSIKSNLSQVNIVVFGFNGTKPEAVGNCPITIFPNRWNNVTLPLTEFPRSATFIDFSINGDNGTYNYLRMKNVEMANVSSYFRNVTIPSIASFHYTVGVTLLSLRQSQYRLYIDGVLQGNFTKSTTKSIQLNNDKNLTISLVMNNPKLNLGIYVTPMVSNATVNPVPELIHRNKDLSSFILQFNNSGSGILFVSESYSPGWEVDMNSSIHGKAEGFGNGFVFSTETAKQIKLFYREPFISFVLLFNFASFVLVVIVTLLLIIPTTNKLIYNIKAKLKVYMMRKISLFNSKMFRRTRR